MASRASRGEEAWVRAPSDLYTASANSALSAGNPFAPVAVVVAVGVAVGLLEYWWLWDHRSIAAAAAVAVGL